MTVEFWIGQEPDTPHERTALDHFRRGMEAMYGSSKDYYFVLVNYFVGSNQVDLTILKRDAIIVVELKKCHEPFVATLNGDWQTPSGQVVGTGTRNPFEQVWDYRMQWVGFLERHDHLMSPANRGSIRFDQAVNALVCISPRLHPDYRNQISKQAAPWFGLVGLDRLAQTVRRLSNPGLSFSEVELRKLIGALNLHKGLIFVDPPTSRALVDRESECSQLMAFLGDNKIAVISLRGPGGVGKTELVAWLVDQAFDPAQVKWIDCSQKQVTLEALLAALAGEMPREQADYIRNPKERQPDRFNAALSYLDSKATLFVFNDYLSAASTSCNFSVQKIITARHFLNLFFVILHDVLTTRLVYDVLATINYHLIADPGPIEEFLTYIVHHARKLRVVLTTRTRSTCLAHPAWPWQAVREICLEGLPFDVVKEFVGPEVASRLTTDQLHSIWKEADGVPYLMKILTKVEFTPGRDEHLNQWLQSLLRTVSDEARHLAYGLSVIRGRLNSSLMQALARTDGQKTSELARELTEQHILREWGEGGTFALYDLARDFLYAQASDKVKCDAHSDAGSHFANVAEKAQEKPERLKYLTEAVYHFEQAANPDKVLQLVGEAHALSRACGYRDEAQQFAEKALAAARKTQKRDETCFWLAQIAEGEIDRDTLDVARTHLKEAEASLPKLGKQLSPEQAAERTGLKMRISIQRSRLAYHTQDYDSASVSFNEALDLARQMGDPLAEADCLIRLGQVQRRRGQYESAKDHFSRARAIADQEKRKDIAFECVSYLGTVTRKQNRVLEAYRL